MRTVLSILQSALLLLWILTYEVYGQTIDQSLCYNSLYNSDTDSDGRLQTDEYVDFISTLSEGYITNDQEYSDLSSVLKVNFSHLSCRCKFNPINAGEDCCLLSDSENNGIWLIEGFMNHSKNPWSDDEVSNFEIWLEGESTSDEYLLALCDDTMKAINYERRYPTYAPTHYHIPKPIAQATNSPTTNQPTIPNISSSSPSNHPTINPVTISPSNHPTTLQPSILPTDLGMTMKVQPLPLQMKEKMTSSHQTQRYLRKIYSLKYRMIRTTRRRIGIVNLMMRMICHSIITTG